jgi:prevent-host-death family protein
VSDPERPSTAIEACSWNLSEAKARFSQVVQRALGGVPQRIVRGGREAVIVVAESEYRDAQRPQRTFVELFSPLQARRKLSADWTYFSINLPVRSHIICRSDSRCTVTL